MPEKYSYIPKQETKFPYKQVAKKDIRTESKRSSKKEQPDSDFFLYAQFSTLEIAA